MRHLLANLLRALPVDIEKNIDTHRVVADAADFRLMPDGGVARADVHRGNRIRAALAVEHQRLAGYRALGVLGALLHHHAGAERADAAALADGARVHVRAGILANVHDLRARVEILPCACERPSVIARNIYSALSELDSANEPYFKHRLDSLQQIIAQTDTDVRDRLRNADTTFLIYHPALSYFARDYGLKQISIEEGGKEPSPVTWNSSWTAT